MGRDRKGEEAAVMNTAEPAAGDMKRGERDAKSQLFVLYRRMKRSGHNHSVTAKGKSRTQGACGGYSQGKSQVERKRNVKSLVGICCPSFKRAIHDPCLHVGMWLPWQLDPKSRQAPKTTHRAAVPPRRSIRCCSPAEQSMVRRMSTCPTPM